MDFDGNSTLEYLLEQVRDRWPEVDPEHLILKYHTPDKESELVVVRNDNDVKNMYRWHLAAGVTHASIVVEKKGLQFVPQSVLQSASQPSIVEVSPRY
ncbi:MAG: hypothetical protein JO131_03205 [Gammaproteobacteria bacterium]|nr:hypothetical protein [Gammaproteobacteria bacterium]